MRKISIALFILALLALNRAALHDILNAEPDVWMDGSFVMGSLLLLAVCLIEKTRQST